VILNVSLHGKGLASASRAVDYDVAVFSLKEKGVTHVCHSTFRENLTLPYFVIKHVFKEEIPFSVVEVVVCEYF